MANKLVVMSKIKQLLRMHLSGASNRKIARELLGQGNCQRLHPQDEVGRHASAN